MLGCELGKDMGQYNMGTMHMLGWELDGMEDVVIGLELVHEICEA